MKRKLLLFFGALIIGNSYIIIAQNARNSYLPGVIDSQEALQPGVIVGPDAPPPFEPVGPDPPPPYEPDPAPINDYIPLLIIAGVVIGFRKFNKI